jgi:hypothetical protein
MAAGRPGPRWGIAAGRHAVAGLPPQANQARVAAAARRRSVGVYPMGEDRFGGRRRPWSWGLWGLGEPAIGRGVALLASPSPTGNGCATPQVRMPAHVLVRTGDAAGPCGGSLPGPLHAGGQPAPAHRLAGAGHLRQPPATLAQVMKAPPGWQNPTLPADPTAGLEMPTLRPARRYHSPASSTAATASRPDRQPQRPGATPAGRARSSDPAPGGSSPAGRPPGQAATNPGAPTTKTRAPGQARTPSPMAPIKPDTPKHTDTLNETSCRRASQPIWTAPGQQGRAGPDPVRRDTSLRRVTWPRSPSTCGSWLSIGAASVTPTSSSAPSARPAAGPR